MKTCHSMILGGGTLISGHSSSKSLFVLALVVFVTKINGTKIYGVGLGVAKIDTAFKCFLVLRIVNNCSYLELRDSSSMIQLTKSKAK